MKKILAVTYALIVLSAVLGAEDTSWLRPTMNFTSEIFKGSNYFSTEATHYPDSTFVERVTIGGTAFGWIFAHVLFDTYMQPPWSNNSESNYFAPYHIDYGNRFGITHYGVSVGWEHACYHPVSTFGDAYTERYGGKTSVYVGFDLDQMLGYIIKVQITDILLPELKFNFRYIYENQALLLNPETRDYVWYETKPMGGIDGTIGFTLFDAVYFSTDFDITKIQIDYRLNAGISFFGVRIGYYYSDYVLTADQIIPMGNWYGQNQGVYLDIDLARIQELSRRTQK